MRAYRVYAIEKGTVIDHIPASNALKVIELLKLKTFNQIVTMGMNLESKKNVRKDVVKIENKTLTKDEINRISLIAPKATINIIKDSKVADKFKVEVPKDLVNMVRCPNPKCITRNEEVTSKFTRVGDRPIQVKCHYCEKVFEEFTLL